MFDIIGEVESTKTLTTLKGEATRVQNATLIVQMCGGGISLCAKLVKVILNFFRL